MFSGLYSGLDSGLDSGTDSGIDSWLVSGEESWVASLCFVGSILGWILVGLGYRFQDGYGIWDAFWMDSGVDFEVSSGIEEGVAI